MAASKVKHAWRRAACLLFLTGPFKYCPTKAPAMRAMLEAHVRGGAPPTTSYLVTDPLQSRRDDMELMFVQRHSKSGFMPDMHVFPGGVLDTADYSSDWLSVFGRLESSFPSLTSHHGLPLYTDVPPPLSGELAFRICAIREMFEEAGVLLVRDKDDSSPCNVLLPGTFRPSVKVLPETVREHWRRKVHNNAHEFLSLCNELNCVPDVWSLVEWSNWLTPRNHKRRFDTVFYLVFSEERPTIHPDGVEVTNSAWMSPSAASEQLRNGQVLLAPPQFAEITKLITFPSSPCLHSYALYNSLLEGSIKRILSVRMVTKDGVMVSVNDLDDLYPAEGSEDWNTEVHHPQAPHLKDSVRLILSDNVMCEYTVPGHTAEELYQLSRSYSRMERHSAGDIRSHDNSNFVSELVEHFNRYSSLYGSKL